MEKTNVMRILDQKKIPYEAYIYPHEEGVCVDGSQVARLLGQNPNEVFKTLVAMSTSKHYYVFVIPVEKELDVKKAAKAVNEKAIELMPVKDLLSITGYVRGGCSPIGMKKSFKTIVDESALQLDAIIFSAGKIGYQVKLNPIHLSKVLPVEFAGIIREINMDAL